MASTSSVDRVKRSRNVLTIEEKVEIIYRMDEGEAADSLAACYKIGKRTIYDIKARKDEILRYASRLDREEGPRRRKTMRTAQNGKLDEAMLLWLAQKRDKGVPVSGPFLCEQALAFNEKLGGSRDFKASTGWLKNFKARHDIRDLEAQRSSLDPAAAGNFQIRFSSYLRDENLSLDDIYNADATGLNWKSLPPISAPALRVGGEHVTVVACANASGTHRLPPLVVGKPKNPRCFKNVKNLPVRYKSQANARMNTDLFCDWYENHFVPEVKKFRGDEKKTGKVVLVLDDAPSRPNVQVLNAVAEGFEARYLPPNATALIQPMDQGLIAKLKRMYRKEVLRRVLQSADDKESWVSSARNLNLKDCCYMIADAWNSLTAGNLRSAWGNMLGVIREEGAENEELDSAERDLKEAIDELFDKIPGFSDRDRECAQAWLETEDDSGSEVLDDDEIIAAVQEENADEENGNANDDDKEEERGPSHEEAFAALETALSWYERQAESCPPQLLLLKRMRDLAARKRRDSRVRRQISVNGRTSFIRASFIRKSFIRTSFIPTSIIRIPKTRFPSPVTPRVQ